MNTKRITAVGLTLIMSFAMLVTPVLAGAPHFGKVNATGPDTNGNLAVAYSINPPIGAGVLATRDAIYACKPVDGDFPPNPGPTEEVIDRESYSGGIVKCNNETCPGVITIPPPAAISLTCSGDTVVTLAMMTYRDMTIYAGYGDFQIISKPIHGHNSATYYGYTP